MKKVLIILGSYLPKPSPNGICVQKIANEFHEQGVDVSILSTQSRGLSKFDIINNIKVYRVKGRWFNRAIEWCNENNNKKSTKIIRRILLGMNKIKNFITLPFWPLISPLYTYRLYRKAHMLYKSNKYDAVISVYNPIDALIAGTLLKNKNNDLKLILYFLDTLSAGIIPKYLSRNWLESRGWKWDKIFFNLADSIHVMESHRNHYFKDRYLPFHDKIEVVDIPLLENVKCNDREKSDCILDKSKINFVYTGSLQRNIKNPTYMLNLYQAIKDKKGYSFHIFGGGDCDDIINRYKSRSKNNLILTHGQVDMKMVKKVQIEADVLINIGSAVDAQIPSKIFEYISAGKPIISFYKTEGEPSIPYLKKYPLSLLIKEDSTKVEENALKVQNFVEESLDKKIDYTEVEQLFKNNTPVPMVQKVISLINR